LATEEIQILESRGKLKNGRISFIIFLGKHSFLVVKGIDIM